jgi:nitrogenase molybdenum-iron protein beta chain
VPTSGVTEREIVFGGLDRLREEIESAEELLDADLFIVATTCMTEMIGDDVEAVVSEFSAAPVPVIALSTPSFKANAYGGYEILLEGLFNRYLPPFTGDKHSNLVNLFGVVPAYDPFFRGDLEELARLLGRLGLHVNTFFTPDQTLANITSAPSAALNIVFSRVYATAFAERFEHVHGTPHWITDLPIGAEATTRFLRELAVLLNLNNTKVERVIADETRVYYDYFSRSADMFSDGDLKFYSATVTNSNYAVSIANFLQRELGWVGLQSFVTDILDDNQQNVLSQAFDALGIQSRLEYETDTSQIAKTFAHTHPENRGQRYFDDITPLYIVGSSLDKAFAQSRGAQALAVSYPVYNKLIMDRGYAGFRGGLHLFEDIIGTIVSGR